jgi:1,4-dihydroxy-2-naphthoyl-CoA hydrolase
MIWFDAQLTLTALKDRKTQTLADWLGIEFTALGSDHLTARMPVNERTRQPMGVLHGGASCVLAETLGSVASALVIDRSRFYGVGLEINANHIKMVRNGHVEGTVRPLHLGRSTHVWEIRIVDEASKLVCISRLTVAILQKQEP